MRRCFSQNSICNSYIQDNILVERICSESAYKKLALPSLFTSSFYLLYFRINYLVFVDILFKSYIFGMLVKIGMPQDFHFFVFLLPWILGKGWHFCNVTERDKFVCILLCSLHLSILNQTGSCKHIFSFIKFSWYLVSYFIIIC